MKKKKTKPVFNVLLWDINHDEVVPYNIMPRFINLWEGELSKKLKFRVWCKDEKKPETFEEFKYFINSYAMYCFWAKCEYEFIIKDWPCQKKAKKIDVYTQIKMNIDLITKLFMDYINGN